MNGFPTALHDKKLIARVDDQASGPHVRAELTDRQLVEAVLEGSHEAFAQLFDRYKKLVAVIASRYFRQQEQVEEIVQISFVKAYSELARFRGQHDASLGSWLSRITANACLDAIRSRRRKPEDLNCELSQGDTATLLDLASGAELDAERELSLKDLAQKLLARLPDDDRALLQMLYIEEMGVAEIASLLGWSKSKVKIRAWRARNVLRKELRHYL